MKTLVPDIKAYLLLHAGMNIQEFYYDWVLQNESGVFVGIEAEDERGLPALQQSYTGKKALHNDIDQLYQRVQKESDDDTYSCMMNEKTILVVRRNILSFMEKEMVRIGREEELKLAKRSLEKPLLDNNRRFEQLLNKKIVDIFADWNFVLDKCVIVIILNQNIVL